MSRIPHFRVRRLRPPATTRLYTPPTSTELVDIGHVMAGTIPPVPRPGRPPKIVGSAIDDTAFAWLLVDDGAGDAFRPEAQWARLQDTFEVGFAFSPGRALRAMPLQAIALASGVRAFVCVGFADLTAKPDFVQLTGHYGTDRRARIDVEMSPALDDVRLGFDARGGRFSWAVRLSTSVGARRLYLVPSRIASTGESFDGWVQAAVSSVSLSRREGEFRGWLRPERLETTSGHDEYFAVVVEELGEDDGIPVLAARSVATRIRIGTTF